MRILIGLLLIAVGSASQLSPAEPIRALLVTGGCCHEYGKQKDIIKKGLESRIHIVVDQLHSEDRSTRPPLPILGNPDYAQGYHVVIHDECGAGISDEATVRSVLHPHLKGIPGVNLHCAMHSYRIGNPRIPAVPGTPHSLWFEYLGLQSSGHGPKQPITIVHTAPEHPILKGFENWRTIGEELYNNIKVFPSATPLSEGIQKVKTRTGEERTDQAVVTWTNLYGPLKTRVFSTTLGHFSETVADDRYLDLIARGLLWATGHLTEEGKPDKGYGFQEDNP